MQVIFAPARAVAARLNLSVNLLVAALLFVIPLATAMVMLSVNFALTRPQNGLGSSSASTLYSALTAQPGLTALMVIALVMACYHLVGVYLATRDNLRNMRSTVERIADGDLSTRIDIEALGDTRESEAGRLWQSVGQMSEGLAQIVNQVRTSADTIANAAREIAAGNSNLSQRTEQQASALEETASGMEQLGATVQQNAENCRRAGTQAAGATDIAGRAALRVQEVAQTMRAVDTSSRRVADIIGIIEGIAFQTNILALNAAVEAARAGEQGRGFAVVAAEVRSLAQRSATAAKEIKLLIDTAVGEVATGAKQAADAGSIMGEAEASVRAVGQLISEIATASSEQESGVSEINRALQQLEGVTQQNAALVEEAAATAMSFEQEAARLVQVVSAFKLDRAAARDQAVALVKRAVRRVRQVGVQRACDEFDDQNGEFRFGDYYVYGFNEDGYRVANGSDPSTRGEYVLDKKDPTGKLFVREIFHIAATRGKGWCDYHWVNPQNGKVEPKSAYLESVDGIIIGCGIYRGDDGGAKSAAPAPMPAPRVAPPERSSAPRLARPAARMR